MKKENLLILIYVCNSIVGIFLGPFLVAYFLKISTDNLVTIAIYYILFFLCVSLTAPLAAQMMKKRQSLLTLRLGIAARFWYVLLIILLKDNLSSNLWLLCLIGGLAATLFWFPYQMFEIEMISRRKRMVYESNKRGVAGLVSVLIPALLGMMITVSNYRQTAVIVLIVTTVELICSLFLQELPKKPAADLKMLKVFKATCKDKEALKILSQEFLFGLCINDAATSTLIAIFIIEAFATDMNMGIINSAVAIVTLAILWAYAHKAKERHDRITSIGAGVLTFGSAVIFILTKNPCLLILYIIMFNALSHGLMGMLQTTRLMNFCKYKAREGKVNDFFVMRELALNTGRVITYSVLLALVMVDAQALGWYFLGLNLLIMAAGFVVTRSKRLEEE